MEPELESAGTWSRIRSILIATGDVVGVLVLIVVIAIIGSHDDAIGSMASIMHHL
ncbi:MULTISPECIES: hypothetical protein [unclassified Nocardia]|uniref:hypothetical protein n=1 Tax=unclassified Nocardia TaxID=2637762 RepID=UPI001CE4584D|nr:MULTISPECIES: hypothetical protein [unclassified Nocardia]